jgi:CubicO group peptidase (beta-lactamase class C family)
MYFRTQPSRFTRAHTRSRLALCAVLAACHHSPPAPASADEIARAERIYRQCVEDELGLELVSLRLAPGDIQVQFSASTHKDQEALAEARCEPRIAFLLDPGPGAVLGPPKNLGRPATDRELSELLAARAKLGFEGAALLESAGSRRVNAGFGRLRAESARVPDSATAFDCGSIMKEVTAALIFLLEREGALSRTQTLGELFSDVPRAFRSVTLAQLLAHQAGFHEYHDRGDDGDFEPLDRATALARILAQPPLFAPGSDTAYSNSGYTLLAALIEDVTGADFRSVVHQRVFAPLGMARSGFYGDGLWEDGNIAVGRGDAVYGDNDPAHWPEPSWALLGNGGLVSTLDDLLQLARAFDGEQLFEPETRAQFRALQPSGRIAGKVLFGYAGGNDYGFDVLVAQVPEDGTYVLAASHVRSPISAEILGLELVQSSYGAIAQLPEDD